VNARERIAKLEALLARVTERVKAPRSVEVETANLRDTTRPPPPADVEVEVIEEVRQVSEPPISIDISDDEVQSSERVVAAPAERIGETDGERMASAAPAEAAAEAHTEPEPEPEPAPEVEVAPEPEPEPPASSRRPIVLESKLEDLAFGDAAPPEAPHTPPPESGRQVASPPVDLDFDSDFTGVRSKEQGEAEVVVVSSVPPPPEPEREPEPASAPVDLAPAQVAPALVASAPEVTLPILPDAPVAVFEGSAPLFKPASLGELLDATLLL